MDTDNFSRAKDYYHTIEVSIGELPLENRENVYRQCAINCVKDTVLKEQQQQFKECHYDLDLQYTKYGTSEFFFAKVIQKGHIYEIGYPRCVCHLVNSGFVHTSAHCECSRQSIIYVLHNLMPNKNIQVKTIETVLSGANKCRFRVIIE